MRPSPNPGWRTKILEAMWHGKKKLKNKERKESNSKTERKSKEGRDREREERRRSKRREGNKKHKKLVFFCNVIQAKLELVFPDLLCLGGSRLGLELEKLA